MDKKEALQLCSGVTNNDTDTQCDLFFAYSHTGKPANTTCVCLVNFVSSLPICCDKCHLSLIILLCIKSHVFPLKLSLSVSVPIQGIFSVSLHFFPSHCLLSLKFGYALNYLCCFVRLFPLILVLLVTCSDLKQLISDPTLQLPILVLSQVADVQSSSTFATSL